MYVYNLAPRKVALEDGAPPAALLGVVRGVDLVVVTVHPEVEELPIILAVCFKDRHNADPVALREDTLSREAG